VEKATCRCVLLSEQIRSEGWRKQRADVCCSANRLEAKGGESNVQMCVVERTDCNNNEFNKTCIWQ
jgi:hypothetical protein